MNLSNITPIADAKKAIIHRRAGFSADGRRLWFWKPGGYVCAVGDGSPTNWRGKQVAFVKTEAEAERFLTAELPDTAAEQRS